RDLIARGAEVQLIEARARLGGRVWSVTDKDFSDTPLELGGEFIDGDQQAIRALCHECKLTLVPVLKEGFGLALDANGRVQVFNGMRPIWSDFKAALAQEAAAFQAVDSDWNSTTAQAIGRHSAESLLRTRGASPEVIAIAHALR